MKRLMIFDGNSIINRAFYGIRLLSTKNGVYTNAVYGFFNIFFKFIGEEKPDYICVAFDVKAPTFRHIEFEAYKAQRKPMPEELVPQIPLAKDILRAMNVTVLEKEGYEADDIIGTVADLCEREQIQCEIITGDKDDLQLATDKTLVYLVTTRNGQTETVIYDDKMVFEKYGVTPTEFIDVKAIMGDPSDNIPGIPGIGEKGALSLISQYKSLDFIYENIENIEVTKSVKQKLIDGKDIAYKSRFLAEINKNVPMENTLEDYLAKDYDVPTLHNLLKELELNNLIKRLDLKVAQKEPEVDSQELVSVTEVSSYQELEPYLKNLGDELCYYIKKENGNVASFAISISENEAVIINKDATEVLKKLRPMFEDAGIKKVTHDIKEDIVLLNSFGIDLVGLGFDTMLAAYLIDPARSNYKIEDLARIYLGQYIEKDNTIDNATGQIMFGDEPKGDNFAAYSAGAVFNMKRIFEDKLKKLDQEKLYYDMELPLAKVLAKMQISGFMVDKAMLNDFSAILTKRIDELTKMIYDLSGEQFNINSPKQLGVILFERLGLATKKKTKTGYSTDIETLERLYDEHPIIKEIIEYRQHAKLKSTYVDGLISVINTKTGKIHSSFNQTVTVTGRISSTEPNLQNIPIRLDLGREIRKVFVASDEEHILLGADYSQIELRVLAHISDDPVMINAFLNDDDIHAITASQVFGVPLGEVTPRMRSNAKAVNFGIIYGIGDFSLSQDLKISRHEAREYIDSYLDKYLKVKEYMASVVEQARRDGFAKTMFGRIRYIPELAATNKNTQAFGERIALNMPIQGTAADIMKLAMIDVDCEFAKRGLKSKVILQVHDELIVDALRSEVDIAKQILKDKMENAVKLRVPLTVEVKAGKSWYETK